MRSENDSEDNDNYGRTLSEYESNDNQKKIISKTKSADGADDDQEDAISFESFEKQKEKPIEPVIKKEDFAMDIEFGKDIVKSEQYSVDAELLQSRNQDKLQKELRRNEQVNRKTTLNIIVCGAKQTGKSTFIQTFQNSKHNSNGQKGKGETIGIVLKKCVRRMQGLLYDISMIDAPGYKQGQAKQYIEMITKEIVTKIQSYDEMQQHQKQDRQYIISGSKSQIVDQRVHCCLYFLKGPRINQEDCIIMQQLQKYVNIIPIISKGDCYTLDQIKQFKKQLLIAKDKFKLVWVECQQIVRAKQPQMVRELLEGPFGAAPPFVMVSGVSKIITQSSRVVQGRRYNWGIVDISNRNHSDFQLLSQMLLIYLSKALVQLTTLLQIQHIRSNNKRMQMSQQSYVSKRKRDKKKKTQKSNNIIYETIGGGIVIGFVGLLVYKLFEKKTQRI